MVRRAPAAPPRWLSALVRCPAHTQRARCEFTCRASACSVTTLALGGPTPPRSSSRRAHGRERAARDGVPAASRTHLQHRHGWELRPLPITQTAQSTVLGEGEHHRRRRCAQIDALMRKAQRLRSPTLSKLSAEKARTGGCAAEMSRVMDENLGGIRVVRAFAAQEHEIDKFEVTSSSGAGPRA